MPRRRSALLEDTWASLRALGLPAEGYEMTPDLVRLAVSAGKVDLAADVALGMEEFVTRGPTPSVRGTARRCRGLIDGDASVLAEAVAQLRSSSRALERACACEEAGQALVHEQDVRAMGSPCSRRLLISTSRSGPVSTRRASTPFFGPSASVADVEDAAAVPCTGGRA